MIDLDTKLYMQKKLHETISVLGPFILGMVLYLALSHLHFYVC